MITFLLPFKGLAGAKTRWMLEAKEKESKLIEMLEHNVATVASVVGKFSTVVVCPNWSRLPEFKQATRWTSPGKGLNQDLESARAQLSGERKEGALGVLLPDLPLLRRQDILDMLENNRPNTITLCPDRYCTGTNALLLNPASVLNFYFEGESFPRYQLEAARLGHKVQIIERPGLAYDADLYSDLERVIVK